MEIAANIFKSKCEASHFVVLCGSILFFIMGSGELYRACAYLNLLFLFYIWSKSFDRKEIRWEKIKPIFFLIWIPTLFILMDILAGNITQHSFHIYTKLVLVILLAFGWLNFFKNITYKKLNIFLSSCLTLSIFFILVQFLVYTVIGNSLINSWHYGTFNNPHHLALFIMLTSAIVFSFVSRNFSLKNVLLVILLLISSWILLKTSSRPAWLALIFGVGVLMPFLTRKLRRIVTILITVLPALLYKFSTQFHDRMLDLISNISTEERVEIWKNSWEMLKDNSLSEWVRGHGMDTFPAAYNLFTQLKGPQYTHPHNFLLEILYISGILGLVLAFILYFYLIKELVYIINESDNTNKSYAGKLSLSIFTMLSFHIFLTLPFYSTYNFYVLVMVYLVIHYYSMLDIKDSLN